MIALAACGMLGANDLLVRKNNYGCCPHGAYSLGEVRSLNNHTYNHWYKQMSNHRSWGWGRKISWCYGETKFGIGSFGNVSLMKWTLPWEVKEAELIGKEEREEHCRQEEQQVQRFLTRESSVIPRSWEEARVAIGENDGDSWTGEGGQEQSMGDLVAGISVWLFKLLNNDKDYIQAKSNPNFSSHSLVIPNPFLFNSGDPYSNLQLIFSHELFVVVVVNIPSSKVTGIELRTAPIGHLKVCSGHVKMGCLRVRRCSLLVTCTERSVSLECTVYTGALNKCLQMNQRGYPALRNAKRSFIFASHLNIVHKKGPGEEGWARLHLLGRPAYELGTPDANSTMAHLSY